jgi:hypothetical protein
MQRHPDASEAGKGLTATPSPVCTRVCTSEPENSNAHAPEAGDQGQGEETAAGTLAADQEAGDRQLGEGTDQGRAGRGSSAADQEDPLAKLAAAIAGLTAADRARLARMLG